MAKRRADRRSWFILLTGIAILILGAVSLAAGSNSCGGSKMSEGDTCITYRDGQRSVEDAEGQRTVNQSEAGALIGLGALMALLGGFLIRGDRGTDPSAPVTDRLELARREGWQFTEVDAELVDTLRHHLRFESSPAAWSVLRGTHDGLRFVIFDYTWIGKTFTAWLVHLPEPSPEFARWATSTTSGWRKPLTDVVVDERAVIGSGPVFRAKDPERVLKPIRSLTELVRRYERSATPRR
ncbi:hypothetical protein ACLQ28_27210 [Micromonospora sp. DT201]|uniref:hypothetical protein n=1 Tax=Micromonospora sp. DT201 TaxID=3393442 RepID=UPI003CEDE153